MERMRLDMLIKTLDRRKSSVALEIDREKSSVVKGFTRVRKTSGFSEEAVLSNDSSDCQTSNSYITGLRISEQRLLEWRETEKQTEKFIAQSEWDRAFMTGNRLPGPRERKLRTMSAPAISSDRRFEQLQRMTSFIDDNVFEESKEIKHEPERPRLLNSDSAIYLDANDVEKQNFHNYSEMISLTQITPSSRMRANSYKTVVRPHTAQKASNSYLPQRRRPHTAHGSSRNDIKIIEREESIIEHPSSNSVNMKQRRQRVQSPRQKRPTSASLTHSIKHTQTQDTPAAQLQENISSDKKEIVGQTRTEIPPYHKSAPMNSTPNRHVIVTCAWQDTATEISYDEQMDILPENHGVNEQKNYEDDVKCNDTKQVEPPESNINIDKQSIKHDTRQRLADDLRKTSHPMDLVPEEDASQEDTDLHSKPEQATQLKSRSIVFTDTESIASSRVIPGRSVPPIRRARNVSVSSYAPSDRGINSSVTTSERGGIGRYGSVSDIYSIGSDGTRRPSKWREYVAADKAIIPENKKFVNVATIVKCALAFSKSARKKALDNLVTEQSMDVGDVIRQERMRRAHSKNKVLSSFAKMWATDQQD